MSVLGLMVPGVGMGGSSGGDSGSSTISYAGVDLIIPATPEAVSWIEAHIRPQDLYEDTFNLGTARPWLWYDWPPKVRIGEVVWPNGAQRWGYAHFLAGQQEVDAILATTGGEGYFDLIINGQLNTDPTGVTFSMAMLPPRPLSRFADVDGQVEPLYLLTFVDKRFYWWQNHVESVTIAEGTTTWAQLFAQMETALGESFTQDAIPAAYLKPSRAAVPLGVPIPILFDNWAYWTGRRVVLDKDGAVFVLNPTSCAAIATNNSITSGLLSGGRFPWKAPDSGTETNPEVLNSFLPDSCSLVFPEVRDGQSTPRVYAVLKTMADAAIPTLSGITGDGAPYGYFYPLAARFTGTASTPDNDSDLQALATQANIDFYSFQLGFLDQQESGTRNYSPDGLHRIEWLFSDTYTATHIVREALPPPGFTPIVETPEEVSFAFEAALDVCWADKPKTNGPGYVSFAFEAALDVCFESVPRKDYVSFAFEAEFEVCFQPPRQHYVSFAFEAALDVCLVTADGPGQDPYAGPTSYNAKVHGSGSPTISASSSDVLEPDQEDWDTAAFWDAGSPSKFAFVTAGAGKYHIDYCVVGDVEFTGSVTVDPAPIHSYLRVNGSDAVANSYDGCTVARLALSSGGSGSSTVDFAQVYLQGSTDIEITTPASDYVEVLVQNDSTVTLTLTGTHCGFSIHRIQKT